MLIIFIGLLLPSHRLDGALLLNGYSSDDDARDVR